MIIQYIQVPVMQEVEHETWNVKNGRIVFTASKGLTGFGLSTRWVS